MKWAYYNDSDQFVCAWLRNLIAAGHLPDGEVDERPIEEVQASDVRAFTQCHFFAGIGGWAYGLQLAQWPAGEPVWTGSCPCQPLSAAGKQQAADDIRHLWPAWYRLIEECRPPVVFGEQVASRLGRLWLTAVRLDLEELGYAVGAADLCAAGVGAPHIRQRLWFVADAEAAGRGTRWASEASDGRDASREQPIGLRPLGELADSLPAGRTKGRAKPGSGSVASSSESRELADSAGKRRQQDGNESAQERQADSRPHDARKLQAGWAMLPVAPRLAVRDGGQPGDGDLQRGGEHGQQPQDGGASRLAKPECGRREGANVSVRPARQVQAQAIERRLSPWDACDWLPCRDGKARPVEPGTFPLAHGIPQRVGRLRAYGNAVIPEVAATFVRAYLETDRVA